MEENERRILRLNSGNNKRSIIKGQSHGEATICRKSSTPRFKNNINEVLEQWQSIGNGGKLLTN